MCYHYSIQFVKICKFRPFYCIIIEIVRHGEIDFLKSYVKIYVQHHIILHFDLCKMCWPKYGNKLQMICMTKIVFI